MSIRARAVQPAFLWVTLLLVSGTLGWAQSVTGTLTGTVADQSGAIVPGANVIMRSQTSGTERTTISNHDGFFSISAVQPGDYMVIVQSKGFQNWQQTNVHFDAGDKRNLSDIALQIGSSTETVQVVGSADLITPVDSGEKSSVIGQKELQNVAVVGRNAAEFIKILPGFAMTGGQVNSASYTGENQGVGAGPVGSFSANGTRTAALDITSDGAHVIDPGCNCGQAVNTNGDMTQELKVLTSNFGAENSKGPVVISAIGKSGGDHFHGEAYLYARNSVFNSNNSYNNSQGYNPSTLKALAPRADTSYYYPGGNISGPVLIPHTNFNKNHDKLFFFFGYEYYKQQIDNGTYHSFVPTQEMRNGNYSSAYLASYLGTDSSGNINCQAGGSVCTPFKANGGFVPASQLNPQGVAMMNLYPLPNANPQLNSGNNYISTSTKPQNEYQLRPRVDYSISEKTKLYVTYNRERGTQEYTDTLWWRPDPTVPWPTNILAKSESDSVSTNLTHVFSPTMTNEFVFTYTLLNLPFTFQNPSKVDPAKLGVNYKHIFNQQNTNEIPSVTGWSDGVANLIQPSGFQGGSLYAIKHLPSFADNLSKVWGTHTAKFGMYVEITNNKQPSNSNVNGEFILSNWGSNTTGNAYSDLMTGNLSQYTESNFDFIQKLAYHSYDFYAQDSWKVSRRLTMDYGMRFQHLGPWVDELGNGFAVFDPTKYNPNSGDKLTGILWHKKDPSIPRSGTPARGIFYNPRFGAAWDVFGTGKTVLRGGFGIYHFHDEQNVQAGAVGISQGAYSFTTPNGVNIADIGSIQPSFITPGSINVVKLGDDKQPETTSYSFTISQRLPMSSLLEVAYVGNRSNDLSNNGNNIDQLNLVPYGALFANNGAAFVGTTSPNATNFRPYPFYGTIKEITHRMYSNYNSLQVSWNKQSGRVNYLLNYTFSKNLGIRGENTNNGVGDPTNLKNDYGVLANDHTHIFNATYIIRLPDPIKGNAILKGAANGWQISGITQLTSGSPLQAVSSSNFNLGGNLANGTVLPDGSVVTSANTVGINASLITGSPDISAQPILTCDPRKNLTNHQYINGNCFALPTPGHNGTFIMPYLKGPSFFNSDLSLFKDFQFSESKKLQFRMEAFNFLNHPLPSFLSGDNNLNLSFNSNGKLSNKEFGYATSMQGRRIVQFALKFYF